MPLLIGIGNAFRRDDGIGLVVAEHVEARNLDGMVVAQHHGEGTELIELWKNHHSVVVVDAVCSGRTPGTVLTFDAARTALPAELFRFSSHLFGLAEAVEMARVLGCLPPRLVVIGVEGADFAAGLGLTEAVGAVVDAVVAQVLAAV